MATRRNLLNLNTREIQKLRDGFAKLQSYPYDDKRGFLFWAGKHGYPDFWCGQHHTPDFLTWHRAYLRAFELALQDAIGESGFGLPYWDWTADGTTTVPTVCLEKTYRNDAGATILNPLFRANIVFPPNVDEWTTRQANSPQWWLTEAAAQARTAVTLPSYTDMQDQLESGHDGLHGWVGGSMGSVTTAAFDPVFWFHHSNVDRLWAIWQDEHPNATLPAEILSNSLVGFPLTGAHVIDYRAMGYDYAASQGDQAVLGEIDVLTAAGRPLSMDFPLPVTGFRRAELLLRQIRHPRDSLQVRVFLNESDADITTPMISPNYAGCRFVFGHGDCAGSDSGHCDWRKVRGPLDPRGPHHMKPFDLRIDISGDLRRAAPAGTPSVKVTLVLVDSVGDPVPADRLRLERIELLTKD
jgi:tyrosinase